MQKYFKTIVWECICKTYLKLFIIIEVIYTFQTFGGWGWGILTAKEQGFSVYTVYTQYTYTTQI